MNETLLIVGDPLENLSFRSDSSLAMAQGALSLGYRVFWATIENIGLLNGTPVISELHEIEEAKPDTPPRHRKIETNGNLKPISQFTRVLIRKDPPFDLSYIDLCWILSQCEAGRVINNPAALLSFHEKLTPCQLVRDKVIPEYMTVPTIVSKKTEELKKFVNEQFRTAELFLSQFQSIDAFKNFRFQILCKPWRGHGGRGIITFPSPAEFQNWLSLQSKTDDSLSEMIIVQPLLPEIHSRGDRRVFVVNGQVQFDFVRYPSAGRIEANLAQGGKASLEEMSEELSATAQKIALYLKQHGILLAGLDFIGDRLTEVNVTSPTGIRTFEELTSKKCTTEIMKHLLEHDRTGEEY